MALAAVLAGSPVAPTHAANINSNAAVCHGETPSDQSSMALSSIGVVTFASNPFYTWVVCAVPRSPLAAGATSGSFYVDGNNPAGKSTICAVYAYGWTGLFLGSSTVNTSDASYGVLVTLTSGQLGTYTYTSLLCGIPPGGVLRGVTTVQ